MLEQKTINVGNWSIKNAEFDGVEIFYITNSKGEYLCQDVVIRPECSQIMSHNASTLTEPKASGWHKSVDKAVITIEKYYANNPIKYLDFELCFRSIFYGDKPWYVCKTTDLEYKYLDADTLKLRQSSIGCWYDSVESAKKNIDEYYSLQPTAKIKTTTKKKAPKKQKTIDYFVVEQGQKFKIDGYTVVMMQIDSYKNKIMDVKECNRWSDCIFETGQVVTYKDICGRWGNIIHVYDPVAKRYNLLKK